MDKEFPNRARKAWREARAAAPKLTSQLGSMPKDLDVQLSNLRKLLMQIPFDGMMADMVTLDQLLDAYRKMDKAVYPEAQKIAPLSDKENPLYEQSLTLQKAYGALREAMSKTNFEICTVFSQKLLSRMKAMKEYDRVPEQ